MEREQGIEAVGHRFLQVAAVAILASAGALGVGRVFQGTAAPLKLVAAALLSVGVAALLRRRGPILAVLGSAAGLVLTLSILVFPDTLYGILPTARTFSEIGRSIHQVSEQARIQVAPTPPLPPLLLAAMTAVWAASFASHALAVRSGSPLLAVLPPAALLAFADIVLDDGARPQLAALFLVGALAVLFLDGLRRVGQWGPMHPWSSSGRRRLTTPTATRGARRLALVALGAALLLPGVLPGYQHAGLLKIDTGPVSSSPIINPLVSVTASLHSQKPITLFLVQSDRPSYWRWMSLDQFDGTSWSVSDLDDSRGAIIHANIEMPRTGLESLAPFTKTDLVHQTITILQPAGPWLPMVYHPDSVSIGPSSVRYDQYNVSASPLVGAQPGLQYTAVSTVVEPTRKQLEAVTPKMLANPEFTPEEQLPQTPQTSELRAIARQQTAGITNPFLRILAIQQWLQTKGGFHYDQKVSGKYDVKTLVNFLQSTKRGFCQQFATAMAVLVRALGYPARVATGFTTGTYDHQHHVYRVTTANAHTWVEVLFPGYGWIPFEPTPQRANPSITYENTPSPCLFGGCPGGGPGGGGAGGAGKTVTNREQFLEQNQNRPKPTKLRPPSPPRAVSRPTHWVAPALGILAALGLFLFLLVLPVLKIVGRRVRVARAGPPGELVLAEFSAFSGRAGDLGLARRPGETLREYRDRLRRTVRFSDGHLERLTSTVGRVAYSADPVSPQEAREAVAASRRAMREIRTSTPFAKRLVGLLKPGW